jgi:lysophospholipase L1-like esterase
MPLGLVQPADVPAVRLRPPGEPDPDWLARHRSFVTRAKQGGVDLLFQGDSLTDMWLGNYRAHFEKTFGHWKYANFAISGDRTEHVLWRLQNGELDGIRPKVVHLLIGTNNLPSIQGIYAAKTPQEVAGGVQAILAEFATRLPSTKILLVGPPPREDRLNALPPALKEDLNPKLRSLNQLLAATGAESAGRVRYLDFFDAYLDAHGHILPGLLGDKLHPAEPGYDIWARAVVPVLAEMLS